MAEDKSAAYLKRAHVVVVGGDSLLAKEIHELLAEETPKPTVDLIASTEAIAAAAPIKPGEEPDEEAVVLTPLTADSLKGAQVAFLAGSPASSRRTLKLNPKKGPSLIDLTGALEEQPQARLRAPSAELKSSPSNPAAAGLAAAASATPDAIQVIAHPAAIAITTLLAALADRLVIRRSLVHVFEPASERGKKGVQELQQQTVAVLAFKKQKTDVFDAQLAFNLLSKYGEEAEEPLQNVEQRLERHLASLLAAHPAIPMPSLRLVQAPVFHGHSFSVWVEFAENPGPEKIADLLTKSGFDVHPDDPPANVSIAGQSGFSIGDIHVDQNQPRACWLWMVADNIRVAAENAIAVAMEKIG